MADTPTLKPCRACGSTRPADVQHLAYNDRWQIECPACAVVIVASTWEDAALIWNAGLEAYTRSPVVESPAATPDLIADLRALASTLREGDTPLHDSAYIGTCTTCARADALDRTADLLERGLAAHQSWKAFWTPRSMSGDPPFADRIIPRIGCSGIARADAVQMLEDERAADALIDGGRPTIREAIDAARTGTAPEGGQ